jgi:hypothetical protein
MSHTKITKTAKTKLELFKTLAQYDENTNVSRLVNRSEFVGDFKSLVCTNGGDWCRQSSFTKEPYNFKFATAKSNGKVNIMWNANDDERKTVEKYFKDNCTFTKGNSLKYFKIFGLTTAVCGSRAIRKDILEHYKNISCANCGSNSELQCDHKNGLYNNPRVLNLETQTLDDFQSLCRHCNCQKRQIDKKTKESMKRYGATNIPCLKPYGIDFIEGTETLDQYNSNAMKGTYWYDPIAFHTHIQKKHLEQLAEQFATQQAIITKLQERLDTLMIGIAQENVNVVVDNKTINNKEKKKYIIKKSTTK